MPARPSRSASARARCRSTPMQLARALSGIASGGVLRGRTSSSPTRFRPSSVGHRLQLSRLRRQDHPAHHRKTGRPSPTPWRRRHRSRRHRRRRAPRRHRLRRQDRHRSGCQPQRRRQPPGTGNARANAWFVGMAPRRNPDIVVAVLVSTEAGEPTAAAPLAAQVINAFVTKQRRRDGNLRLADMRPACAPHLQPAARRTAPSASRQRHAHRLGQSLAGPARRRRPAVVNRP
jgi:penicillin-binding protein 2